MSVKECRPKTAASRIWIKLILFGIVTALCGFATAAVVSSKPEEKILSRRLPRIAAGMPVSIRLVAYRSHAAVIRVLGEVVPRRQTVVKAQVDGQVTYISNRLQVGRTFKRGEVLARLAKSGFVMQVAEAKGRLAAAEVNLQKEQREARTARQNWSQSGIKGRPGSPLVLRQPQLAAARAEVEAAKSALAHARQQLSYTVIRAPYEGVVMACGLNPGETLFAGDQVATMYGLKIAEIAVHLDAAKRALLPETVGAATVKLVDPDGRGTWKAEWVRESLHLNRDSRLRTIYLEVRNPLQQTPPLLPGTFVRAEITGRPIPGLLRIPEAALTQAGIVWLVDRQNRLMPVRPQVVFHEAGAVYIRVPQQPALPVSVAVSPNASFMRGLRVKPINEALGV